MSFPFPRPFPGPSAMVSYSVLSLFMSGEQGVWYDPSDFTTMFQDSAGTTPVTAVEQPVGLILDKSKGLTLGSELVTNGDFSGGTTGWTGGSGATISIVSGGLLVDDPTSAGFANQAITTIANRYYKITAQFVAVTAAANPNLWVGTTNLTANLFSAVLPIGTTGTITGYFLATGTTSYLSIGYIGTGQNVTIDNVSVRELPGNHASQATSASRPVLSARVNLLTYSERFDNAAWAKSNSSITPNDVIAPNGTTTADSIIDDATAGYHNTNRNITNIVNVQNTVSIYAKQGTARYLSIASYTAASSYVYAMFDLQSGVVTTSAATGGTYTAVSSSVTAAGNEWYQCSLTFSNSSISGNLAIAFALSNDGTITDRGMKSYTGSGSNLYLWGADHRYTNVGVNLPAYQRVAAATDYDTSGFPLYLKFDGVDDSLATGTIDFTATDKMSVFAGVRKLSDAAEGFIVELSDTLNAGTFRTYAPRGGATNFSWRTGGSSLSEAAATYVAPISAVVTGVGNISADVSTLRVNGVQAATNAADQGTGNFGNYPIYIGRRNNATSPLNGNLYSLIVRGALSTDAQIASTETYVNNLTKAY